MKHDSKLHEKRNNSNDWEKGSIPVQDLFDSDFSFLKLLKTHNFHFLYLFLYVVVFVPIDERLFSVYGCFFTYRLKVVFIFGCFFT